jgi:mannose-6-phosphate isomerase-like protein (cupin superfamily)
MVRRMPDRPSRVLNALQRTTLGLLVPLLTSVAGCNSGRNEAEASDTAASGAAGVASLTGQPGQITAVSGPGGLISDALAEGTFLGKGAKLSPGQHVETPKGTLCELELADVRIRLNEQTSIELPGGDHPDALVLTRGELVVIAGSDDGKKSTREVLVAAGDETLHVATGEVQVRNIGSTRHFAVVSGHAVLHSGDQSFALTSGESLDAPLPSSVTEKGPELRPELSLRPLEDTGWSRVFDTAAQMADSVPRGVGSLTARRPGSTAEQQQLRLVDQKVTVNIAGRIAHTEIEQAFFNDRAVVLEGIYRFPLPGDGSISGLSLLVGNTWMDGEMLEKQRARQIFQQIVDATVPRDPALLEWEQGNMFKLRIFPIPGRGERRIRLSYTQVLPVVGDTLRYRFPMGGSGATGTEIERFDMTINVDRSQLGEGEIATPMLAMSRRDLEDRVELRAQQERFFPTYDVGVDIAAPQLRERVQTQTHVDQDGQPYFMVSLRPELELTRDERPTHYAFVLDRSHSTSPELWAVGRGLVEALVGVMDPDDRFTVLTCDTACDESPEGLQAPEPTAIDRTRAFLEEQDLAGATDVGNMLVQAAEALARSNDDAHHVIVHLGDGTPSSGELAADKLAHLVREPLADARVLAVALGARSDLTTLSAIVELTGGDLVQADARDDLRELVRELRLRAQVPVARDLEIDLPLGMSSVHRHGVTGLRSGDSLVLTGKLDQPVSGEIRLRARNGSGVVEQSFPVSLAVPQRAQGAQEHLPRTWAHTEIAHLTRTEGFDARERIVSLSQRFTVLSRHTALLVLENDAMYREFNVVRQARKTDAWSGKLDDASAKDLEDADASERSTTRTEVEEEPAPADDHGPSSAPAREVPTPAEPLAAAPKQEVPSFDPDPFPGRSGSQPSGGFADAEPDLDEVLGSLDDEVPGVVGGNLGATGAGRGAGGMSSPPPAPATKRALPSSAPAADLPRSSKPKSTVPSGAGGPRHWHRPAPVRTLAIRPTREANSRSLAQIERLRTQVAADPTKRTAHGQLVRAAIRVGHPETPAFARDWAEVDPDHPGALLALADVLASQGDPLSLRAYASATEVSPFSSKQHDTLARAFASKGDLRRACSHRRALVSIDPSKSDHHAMLAACLHHAGRITEAQAVLRDGERRATDNGRALRRAAEAIEKSAVVEVELHRSAELRATLTWTGEDDLDVALVDGRGRRLSAMRPQDIRVREDAGREELTLRRVRGTVFIEVSRAGSDPSRRLDPIRAELELKTPHGRRVVPVVIEGGSVRLAQVAWQTRWR